MSRHPSARLLARLVGALVSEDLLRSTSSGDGEHRLDLAGVTYVFTARRGAFGALAVDPDSVRRISRGILGDDESEPAHDPGRFLVDAAGDLGLTGTTVANYLAELAATLAADAAIEQTAVTAKEAVSLPHQEIEGHLTGHPLLVANKGRLGFSASDVERYAPESRTTLRPVWLAAAGLVEMLHVGTKLDQT